MKKYLKVGDNFYKKTVPWEESFHEIRRRCANKNPITKAYKHYVLKGIECRITAEDLKAIFFRDKAWLMKKPTVDRIDPKGHYEASNCRYMEHRINCARQYGNWKKRHGNRKVTGQQLPV